MCGWLTDTAVSLGLTWIGLIYSRTTAEVGASPGFKYYLKVNLHFLGLIKFAWHNLTNRIVPKVQSPPHPSGNLGVPKANAQKYLKKIPNCSIGTQVHSVGCGVGVGAVKQGSIVVL